MPPVWLGAIMHSMRRTGSGTSNCVSVSWETASSALTCIHSRRASVPSRAYAGSSSRIATASSMLAPGRICSAVSCIIAVIRASSS